ncbi:MAG: hypothetical protein IKO03_00510 [Lachnospiraceae bacterium]|nr:hypothetical protein [Lachnospiraceae bacterium]
MKMTKKQRMVNRFWAWLLTLVMILGLVPIEGLTARAEGFIVVGPGGDDGETKFELVETLDDLQDGDTCVLMGRDLATSSWYVLTSSGDVMQATYEDGEISIITPEGMDILPDLARMTVESMTVINGSAQIEGGFDYATLYLELGEGTGWFLCESEMSVTWRSSEYELTAGVDANGVYLGNIYMSYTEGDPSSLEAYNEPWLVNREVCYEGTADEYIEYRIGLPWSETVDDWSNPTAYLYKIPSETQQVNPPAAPANFQTEADNELGAKLSWEASEGATAYVVYCNDVVLATTEELEYQDSDLTAGNAYSYAVSAKNRGGESDKTAAISVTATLAVPPMPTNLTVTPGLRGTLDMSLSWSAPEPLRKTTGYHVYRDGVRITESPITETTYVDQAEYAGQNLTYAVTAVNASGESEKTSEVGAKAPSVLPPSCDVTVSLNLPNAGFAKAFLSKSGCVQLRGERSYSLPITQDGDAGTYEFSDVLEDTYELALVISGKVVYSQPSALTVTSGEANAISADLSTVTNGFHGMVRIKQPGIVSSYHLKNNGYGWSVNEEGYLVDPNGNTAFWWSGERVFVKGTEYVYKAEEDKCYQLLDQVGVDLSKVTTGLTYQLPVGAQEDLVVVHVALTAAGVDLNQFYVMTNIWQNGMAKGHGSLYLDHEGKAVLLLPAGSGYEVSLRVLKTEKDGVIIPEKMIERRGVTNGDTISESLIADLQTVTIDFSDSLAELPAGVSLEGISVSVYSSATLREAPTVVYLDSQGKASARMIGDASDTYVAHVQSRNLSDVCTVNSAYYSLEGTRLKGKLNLTVLSQKVYKPVFQIQNGADMNGVKIHFNVDGQTYEEILIDTDGDGKSDNAFEFSGYEVKWKVREQLLPKKYHLAAANGSLNDLDDEMIYAISLRTYKTIKILLPNDGDDYSILVYNSVSQKYSEYEKNTITADESFTIEYIPSSTSAGTADDNQNMVVMVMPKSVVIVNRELKMKEWENLFPKLVKSFDPDQDESLDFSDIMESGGLYVRDLDGNAVNDYVGFAYVHQGQVMAVERSLNSRSERVHVALGENVKCMILPFRNLFFEDQKGANINAFAVEYVPNGRNQTIYLPYQMIYRLNILGADGQPMSDSDLNQLIFRMFDQNHYPDTEFSRDQAGTQFVLTNPLKFSNGNFTLFVGYGDLLDDVLSNMYPFWENEKNAVRKEINIFRQSGIVNICLKDKIVRINRRHGLTTELKNITALPDGNLLVRLSQTSYLMGDSYIKLPEGAYDIKIDHEPAIMVDGKVLIQRYEGDTEINRHNLCFAIQSSDLLKDNSVLGYVLQDGKYVEQRCFRISADLFSYGISHDVSSNEIVYDEPVESSVKKGELVHAPNVYGLQTVGGRFWDPDPIIDGTTVWDVHYRNMEEYRKACGIYREGVWLKFETRQVNFEIALNIDGIPVEYSDSIMPFMPPSSLGMFASGSFSSGGYSGRSAGMQLSRGYSFFKNQSSEKAETPAMVWEDAAEGGAPHIWIPKEWLESYGLYNSEEGVGYLFVPMSEPERYPNVYEVEICLRYIDGIGQKQIIKNQDYVTVYEDAPILEKWYYEMEINGKDTDKSPVYHSNIRSREARKEYEKNRNANVDLFWNGTLAFTFRARFDDPDMVENVYAVANVPEDCDNFAFRLERVEEDADGYNYVGTGILGDYLNPPKDFGISYSLKVARTYENMPSVDLANLSDESDLTANDLPEGWTVESVSPENGWTLAQTEAAWNLYAKDVADGVLDDFTPYVDGNLRLYWPAMKVMDDKGEPAVIYENYIDFSEKQEERIGYSVALMDQGEYKATLKVSTDYDPDNVIMTQTLECSDASYLLPVAKKNGSALNPMPFMLENNDLNQRIKSALASRKLPGPDGVIKIVKAGAGKAATISQTAKYYGERANVIKPYLEAGKEVNTYGNLYGDFMQGAREEAYWASNMPEDMRMEYIRFHESCLVGNALTKVVGSIPGIGLLGKYVSSAAKYAFVDKKIENLESHFRRYATMNSDMAARALRIKKYLQAELDAYGMDYLISQYGRELIDQYFGENPCYHIDPSGYVYEGIESHVVQGVTATIYQYTGSTAGWTFDANGVLVSGTPEADKWVVWDSESYGEDPNPHNTDAYGHYGWDVLIGAWKVVFEKDGYVSAESAVLNVPPAHTDVNLSMVAITGAKVKELTANEEYVEIVFDKPVLVDDVTSLVTICVENDKNVLGGSFTAMDEANLGTGNKQAAGAEDVVKLLDAAGADAKAATTFRYAAKGLSLGQKVLLLQTIGVRSYNGIVAQIDYASTNVQKKADPITSIAYVGSVAKMNAKETRNLVSGLIVNGTEGSLTWTSMVPEVATVDNNGVLTAKETDAGGNAIVKVAVAGTDASWIITIPVAAKGKPITAATPVNNLPKNHAHVWGAWTVTKNATETEEGSKSHFCTLCGVEEAEVIPAGSAMTQTQEEFYYLDPTSGSTSYVSGAVGGMKVVVKHTTKDPVLFVTFVGIEVDGIPVDKANYVAEAGSVKITLLKKYLDTLSVGEHTMRVLFSDSSHLEFKFTILPAPEKGSITSPASGDNGTGAFSWAVLALVSCAVVTGSLGYRRRRKEKKVA